ncbi:MAG: 3(2), 5-bisphosphate nucleotidase [Actinomycetota bacterium]|nr:3(2), 5-bisphosphate nucleotidase [Actinomycetota bacterium]
MNDHELAADTARRAGELLVELRNAGIDDEKELRRRGDHESNEFILPLLTAARPGDAILSEESKDDAARLAAARVWIVDPLDGTREFGEAGRTDWAVHVALVEHETPTAAAVALPAQGQVLSTVAPPAVAPAPSGGPRIVVSRTRPPALASFLAERLDGELVAMGSAGAKTMSIIQGTADIYAHSGGQYEWDSAAPVGVAASAGLHTSRLDGSPLRYNQPNPYLPDLLVCRPELAARALEAIAAWPGD